MRRKDRKRKIRLWFGYGVSGVCLGLLLCGCSSVKSDPEESPVLLSYEIDSYNEGSEKSQYVALCLHFDREVQAAEKNQDSLRIRIAGERVKEDEYEISAGEEADELTLTISVDAVTRGVLTAERSEKAKYITDITDASGKYCAEDFELEAVIPSGVSLTDLGGEPYETAVSVDSVWNIRSILWVGVTAGDGEAVPVQEEVDEVLDGRIAVHGHEFLTEDTTVIAGKIADTLTKAYPDGYSFSSEKNVITVRCTDGSNENPGIEAYLYKKQNGVEEEEE